jgi:DNA-binding GntR family transcriptional regulator
VRVAEFSAQDFVYLLHLREGLEGIAARLATQNISPEDIEELRQICHQFANSMHDEAVMLKTDLLFHLKIAKSSGSTILESMLCDDFYSFFRIWRRRYPRNNRRSAVALKQHLGILDAIESRDAELAEYLMRHHVRTSRETFLKLLENETKSLSVDVGPKGKRKK